MRLSRLLLAAGIAAGAIAQNATSSMSMSLSPQPTSPASKPAPFSTFGFNIIFQPDKNHNIVYPRIVELSTGEILATAGYNSTPGVFAVFRSVDGGASWEWFSNITDQVNGLGMGAQPFIGPELTEPLGDWPAGTILASGNSWGNASSNIDLYGSKDRGKTWEFISNVARGAGLGLRPPIGNGLHIFEPFILIHNGTAGVFYSDERDPRHSQKLCHQESTNLVNWTDPIDDVAYPRWSDRPGMTVIDYIPPLKKYIFVHEFPGGDSWSDEGYPVYYRLSDSPFTFGQAYGYPIVAKGRQPGSSPFVVWTPAGGENGTVIVSDATYSAVFTNNANAMPDQWVAHATDQPDGYSRAMHVMKKNPDHVMIMGAAHWPGSDLPGVVRPLSVTVFSVEETLKKGPGDAGPLISV